MRGITEGMAFLVMWFGFTVLMIVVLGIVLLWGIRARQFTDQDRARYLPLDGPLPERKEQ